MEFEAHSLFFPRGAWAQTQDITHGKQAYAVIPLRYTPSPLHLCRTQREEPVSSSSLFCILCCDGNTFLPWPRQKCLMCCEFQIRLTVVQSWNIALLIYNKIVQKEIVRNTSLHADVRGLTLLFSLDTVKPLHLSFIQQLFFGILVYTRYCAKSQ